MIKIRRFDNKKMVLKICFAKKQMKNNKKSTEWFKLFCKHVFYWLLYFWWDVGG